MREYLGWLVVSFSNSIADYAGKVKGLAILVVDGPALDGWLREQTPFLTDTSHDKLAALLIPHFEKEVARRTGPTHYLPLNPPLSLSATLATLYAQTTENIIVLSSPTEAVAATLFCADVYSPGLSLIDVEGWSFASAKRVFGCDPRWATFGDKAAARKAYDKRWEFYKQPREDKIAIGDIALQTPTRLMAVSGSQYIAVQSEEVLAEMVDVVRHYGRFAFDTETTGLKVRDSQLVGLSMCPYPGRSWYIPVGHREGDQLSIDTVYHYLRDLFEDEKIIKYGHKISFDVNFLEYHAGFQIKGAAGDSKTLAWMLGYGAAGGHNRYDQTGLKKLAENRLAIHMMDFATTIAGRTDAADTPIDKMTQYAAADADMTLRLVDLLYKELSDVERDRYHNIEMPFLRVVSNLEMRGVYFNLDTLKGLDNDFRTERIDAEYKLKSITNNDAFNPKSPSQVSKYLFGVLGLPPTRKTKTGYSTDGDSLEKLKGIHPAVDLILEYKQITKLIDTYSSGIPEAVSKSTGRVHSLFSGTGTSTGRISSQEPNLMNIPVRTERGARFRYTVEAQLEHEKLLGVDYSQIEPRVLAHFSGEQFLIDIFTADIDLYRGIGAKLWNKKIDDITKKERDALKVFWLAATYLVGTNKLSNSLTKILGRLVPPTEAASMLAEFYKTVPKVREYQMDRIEFAQKHGYVETLLGFRIYIPDINSPIDDRRAHANSQAVDVGIQGTASGDIMKIAMLRIDELTAAGKLPPMILQVHDELIFEGEEEWLKSSIDQIQSIMENAVPLLVPLKAEPKVGKTWGDIK